MSTRKNQIDKNTLKKKDSSYTKYRGLPSAVLHITASSNNAIFNLTTENGDTICQLSCGKEFKNTKKSSPHAFQVALSLIMHVIRSLSIPKLRLGIHTDGVTGIRDSLAELGNGGFSITSIYDKTSTPHNGCRPPKAPKK